MALQRYELVISVLGVSGTLDFVRAVLTPLYIYRGMWRIPTTFNGYDGGVGDIGIHLWWILIIRPLQSMGCKRFSFRHILYNLNISDTFTWKLQRKLWVSQEIMADVFKYQLQIKSKFHKRKAIYPPLIGSEHTQLYLQFVHIS